jgi:hypothetical protein
MDSHTTGALNRLEVMKTGRRRRWSEEKARIVLESMAEPRSSKLSTSSKIMNAQSSQECAARPSTCPN